MTSIERKSRETVSIRTPFESISLIQSLSISNKREANRFFRINSLAWTLLGYFSADLKKTKDDQTFRILWRFSFQKEEKIRNNFATTVATIESKNECIEISVKFRIESKWKWDFERRSVVMCMNQLGMRSSFHSKQRDEISNCDQCVGAFVCSISRSFYELFHRLSLFSFSVFVLLFFLYK